MAHDVEPKRRARRQSEAARAFSEDGPRKTHVGGQALIEGVMMRGVYNWAVAVREPDGGMHVEEHELASGKNGNAWMHWPVVRGCRAFVESLMLGYKALGIAAMHAYADDETEDGEKPAAAPEASAPSAPNRASADACGAAAPASDAEPLAVPVSASDPLAAASAEGGKGEKPAAASVAAPVDEDEGGFGKREMAVSMALGLVLGVALFIVAPAFITNLAVGEYDANPVAWNIVDGVLRVAVFVFYIWLIGRVGEIKRMFSYHGAEHKTIHCYEHGLPLTPENARSFPRLHVRCGTAFLIMVMIIAIFVYTAIPLSAFIGAWGVPDGAPKLALVIAVRILFLPVIAGISYEITVKWAGSHPENPLVKVVLWPGMQMQRLTTKEPDDGMLECAIAAMQRVLDREQAEATARG